jgi:electron transport complex protein RnfG
MAKKESTYFNMAFSLVVITLVSSTVLGYVYELTKGPIAAAKLAKKIHAIAQVVPKYDNNPVDEMYKLPVPGEKDSLEVYPAKENGKAVGYAIRTFSHKGYGGDLWIMVGFSPEGDIQNTVVLDMKETPGLGTKLTSEKFKSQFVGKNPAKFKLKVKKDGGDVDALTGATISSRAFTGAVQLAYDAFMKGGKHD